MRSEHDFFHLAMRAVTENPMLFVDDSLRLKLTNPDFDISFESLEMDSLSRMEMAIWLELELGIEISEAKIQELGSLVGLRNFLRTALSKA